jgi:outer membrane immunogenic protein
MKKFLLAVAVCALATPAGAADILPFYRAPPFGPVASWTGFYVGINAGWTGSWTERVLNVPSIPQPAPNGTFQFQPQVNLHDNGFLGGGQMGFDWQFAPNFVAGVEADFDGVSGAKSAASVAYPGFAGILPFTTTYSRELDSVGTLRGRFGYLSSAVLLWYATGGLAYGQTKFGTAAVCPLSSPCTAASSSTMSIGWTFGGGVDWQFAPGWSLRAEYLYIDLGTVTNTVAYNNSGIPGSLTSKLNESDNIVRVGLNYKLLWPGIVP